MATERFILTLGNISDLLNELLKRHDDFKKAKRNGKVKDFYQAMGNAISSQVDGTMVDNLLRIWGDCHEEICYLM